MRERERERERPNKKLRTRRPVNRICSAFIQQIAIKGARKQIKEKLVQTKVVQEKILCSTHQETAKLWDLVDQNGYLLGTKNS